MEQEGINTEMTGSSIERLQLILETEQKHAFRINEVKEIAYDLINFFELLAEGSDE